MAEENKKISLSELIYQTKKFVSGDITQEEFGKLGEKMTIRSYLPILEKYKILMLLVYTIENEQVEEPSLKTIVMKKHLFFDVLLGQYAMIDINDNHLCSYTSYDLLYPLFSEFILGFCKKDYEEFVEMLKDSINFNNLANFGEIFESLDYQELQKIADKNRATIEVLKKSKEIIADLKEIYGNTSPENKKLTNALEKAVMDKINEQGLEGLNNESENNT